MSADKPYAPACERNREPILGVLRECLRDCGKVLEIGSGTGQHAVYFAAALPHLVWQTSDLSEQLPGIRLWLDEAGLPNTPDPIELAAASIVRPAGAPYDAVFTANTLHIMSWHDVQALFGALPGIVQRGAKVVVYGPFHINGRPTSAGNADFDAMLRAQASHMGVRDLQAVDALASAAGLRLQEQRAMPANNLCLIWQRV